MITQIMAKYLDFLDVEKGLSPNTIDAYNRDLNDFFDFCGVEADKIQRTQVNSYIRNLHEKKYSPTSIMRKIASLRNFFKWASSNEIIKTNPTITLEQPKVPQRLPKVITTQEIEEILKQNLNKTEKVIVELLYGCGLRVSELVNLKTNDYDLNGKYLKCTGKGSKERIVPIGTKACSALKIYFNLSFFVIFFWSFLKEYIQLYIYR